MIYRIPAGVSATPSDGYVLLTTPQGGRVACEPRLQELWQLADGCSIENLLAREELTTKIPGGTIRAALACLAEAGLLVREGWNPPTAGKEITSAPSASVSVVIVNFNSQEWLAECLPSVLGQTVQPAEVVVVDNASSQDPSGWLRAHFPQARVIRLAPMQGLASAINRGVEQTRAEFILILNPDVRLEPDALEQMLKTARSDTTCAAVAPKLKFWWAPGFLNGIGNQPGFFKWGSDIGLGHLDLGQFDDWEEVPSVCFAAALVRRSAWEAVGPADEGFRFYYEDTEWSYRARMLGWQVRAAPQADIYHAFGRRVHTGQEKDLTPPKLRNVVYGRLRFVGKIASGKNLLGHIIAALLHDCGRALLLLLRGEGRESIAVLHGWADFLASLPELRQTRQGVQSRRAVSPAEIFSLEKGLPPPLVWRGLPKLSMEIIVRQYLPAIRSGKTRELPEFGSRENAGQSI